MTSNSSHALPGSFISATSRSRRSGSYASTLQKSTVSPGRNRCAAGRPRRKPTPHEVTTAEARQLRLRRLEEKQPEGLFLRELENGLELSPKVSELVLESAHGVLIAGMTGERGKHYVVGVEVGERAGSYPCRCGTCMASARRRAARVVTGFSRPAHTLLTPLDLTRIFATLSPTHG